MEFETSQQQLMRSSVKKFALKEFPKYQVDKYYNTVPMDLFKTQAELGLAGLAVDEEWGGICADPVSISIVMEEMAAVDLGPAIFTSVHTMVSGLINRFGDTDQKKKYLPKLAAGEFLAGFAITEANAGSDAGNLRTKAEKKGANYILNGEKCWISSAGFANLYLVFAKTDPEQGKKGISAFIVEDGLEGLTYGKPEQKMGCALSPIATMTLTNTPVSKNNRLGAEGKGYGIALSGLAGGRINMASCANGISRAAINKAVKYLGEREQFGRKLVDMQGLRFMLADMRIKLEAARMLTWRAAARLASNPRSRSDRIHPSIAKCFATDAAMSITTDAVQLLGAPGYVREYDVERYMRDAKMLQIVEGTNQIQRAVIAKEMVLGH
ncbi:acyl-CoA dehydrogenase family protein [Oligoflexia bacterium]|nr:acyl-CoA dehydrogenase family protein [Oligoflexia bacterium]